MGAPLNFLNVQSEKQTETMFTISKQIYKNWEENLDTFVIGYNKLHLLWYFARTLAQVHFIS